MIDGRLRDALNEHLGAELYASHLYWAMAAYCESIGLPGFARWMHVQSSEERDHAGRFQRFVERRGGRVTLGALGAPPEDFGSPVDMFEAILKEEQGVTERIHGLHALAVDIQDPSAQGFLQEFSMEQVEEESTAEAILQSLRRAGDDPATLLMIDRELGARSAGEG